MAKVVEGKLTAEGKTFALVAGRFNGFIVDSLVQGALDAVARSGGNADGSKVIWAPGAFEIPQVLRQVLAVGGVDAVICLGAVIRGSTPHFEYVSSAVTRGVESLALTSKVPVTFGVLTVDTIDQAIERAGTKAGNKGFEAGMAAIEMSNLFQVIG